MNKHTPGPWVVAEEAKIKHPEGTFIAQAQYWPDAYLIAAAPDMYEQHKLNQRCRDIVDNLLAEAGYAEDSSVRHQLACMNFDAIAKAIAHREPEKQEPGQVEFDYRHPRAQALIANAARNLMCIDLIWRILKDPHQYFTASDMEYWDEIHDAVRAAVTKQAEKQEQQEKQELTDEQIHSACLSYRQLNALRLRRGTPAAWVNFNAATGERNVSFVCESELASIPLWPEPPCEQGVNK
jgi:hypothetical protein